MAAKKYSPEEGPEGEKRFRYKLRKIEIIKDWEKRSFIISQNHATKIDSIYISVYPQDRWELCIALTKKIKGACCRNRIKRIIREVYRTTKNAFDSPLAMVFTVAAPPIEIDYNKLKTHVIDTFTGK